MDSGYFSVNASIPSQLTGTPVFNVVIGPLQVEVGCPVIRVYFQHFLKVNQRVLKLFTVVVEQAFFKVGSRFEF